MSDGIMATTGSSKPREIVPHGTHIARCYSMVHIGTIEWEYMGDKKYSDKVRISFELPHEMREWGEDKFESPMSISKEYTLSMHEKSNLRKDLESWRGKSFNDNELPFDVTQLIGKCCNLSVIHKSNKSGNEYAYIGGISSLTKGTECPEQFNPSFIFNYENNFDEQWVDNQPDWIQEQIKSTPEYFKKMKG